MKTLPPASLRLSKITFFLLTTISFNATAALDAEALLTIDLGVAPDRSTKCSTGSCFSMEVAPSVFIWTMIEGNNGLILGPGHAQPASGSHSGLIDGSESPGIDRPWEFFGNTGMHQTTKDVLVLTDDIAGNATLDFEGWNVTWNGILSIPVGGCHLGDPADNEGYSGCDSDQNGVDDFVNSGIASISCYTDSQRTTKGTCSNGEFYTLEHEAVIPVGNESGFGGVAYALTLRGKIESSCLGGCNPAPYDVTSPVSGNATFGVGTVVTGNLANSIGNTTGSNIKTADVGVDPQVNPSDGHQCVGGCFDFEITGIPDPSVKISFPVSGTIPAGTVYRKLIDGQWKDFDTSTGDAIGSQAKSGGACQSPDGSFEIGLIEGNGCIFLDIQDGGPNDADGKVDGKVSDPGGIAVKGSSIAVIPAAGNDGCSMSGNTSNVNHRADWLLITGFILWLGLVVRKKSS